MQRLIARLRARLFDLLHPFVDPDHADADWCIRCDRGVLYRGETCRRCGLQWGHE